MRLYITAALVWLTLIGSRVDAFAQGPTGPSVFGSVALQKLWDDEGSIGLGPVAGGGISLPVGAGWQVRGRLVGARHERDFGNGVVFENDGLRYTAEMVWHFNNGSHAPYIGGGVGGFTYRRRSTFGPDPRDPNRTARPTQRFSSSGTDLIGGAIGGVTAYSRPRFEIRPEVSMWLSQSYFIQTEFTLAFGWRW